MRHIYGGRALTQQIFISYARDDNRKLRTDDAGWVDDFDEALVHELRARGLKFKCWRDTRDIRQDQGFDVVIREAVAQSSLFVAIVSPNYIESAYCICDIGTVLRNLDPERSKRMLR